MKSYMSFWSCGYQKQENLLFDFHKISSHFLKKNFGEVHLITDNNGQKLLKDIKFDSISTDLENLPKNYSSVWSLGKIQTYKIAAQKGDPFLHVDYDVILWEGLLDGFDKSDLIVQSVETNAINFYEIDKFIKNCPDIGILKNLDLPKNAFNCGIFGGHDLEFIYKYSTGALDLILNKENENFFCNYQKFFHQWTKAAIVEQYYLAAYAQFYNKKIDSYILNINNENHVSQKKYTHIWGAKNRPEIINQIKKILNKL